MRSKDGCHHSNNNVQINYSKGICKLLPRLLQRVRNANKLDWNVAKDLISLVNVSLSDVTLKRRKQWRSSSKLPKLFTILSPNQIHKYSTKYLPLNNIINRHSMYLINVHLISLLSINAIHPQRLYAVCAQQADPSYFAVPVILP